MDVYPSLPQYTHASQHRQKTEREKQEEKKKEKEKRLDFFNKGRREEKGTRKRLRFFYKGRGCILSFSPNTHTPLANIERNREEKQVEKKEKKIKKRKRSRTKKRILVFGYQTVTELRLNMKINHNLSYFCPSNQLIKPKSIILVSKY